MLRDGFSFYAFIFGAFWFFYHKMWQEAIVILLIDVMISNISFFSDLQQAALKISISIVIGFNANEWLEKRLIAKKGYKLLGIFFGANEVEAQAKVIENNLEIA